MDKLLAKIGWAAGDLHRHAHLLTLDRDDPHGSAAVEDEEREDEREDEKDIVNEDDHLEEDDLDDQPRGKRDRETKAYDKLKSERDRFQAESQKQARLLEEMNARLARMEQAGRETREETNRRTDEAREALKAQAREHSRKLREELGKLDKSDPNYSQKYFDALEEHNEQIRHAEREALLQEIEARSSQAVVRERSNAESQAEAKRMTLAELQEQGLGEECFDLVQALAIAKGKTDPDWFRRTPSDDQIPELVHTLKERLMNAKRSSQDFRDAKRTHRADMDGVLGEGSTSTKRGRTQDTQDEEGPGSILADVRRNREQQRKFTRSMLSRVDR